MREKVTARIKMNFTYYHCDSVKFMGRQMHS